MSLWVKNAAAVELRPAATEDELQSVIRAVYKQVLGNAHLMESDRLISAESDLRNGNITVRGFVARVAKSDLYRTRFFETSSQYRFIELNFKHLLGRAPQEQSEIAEHVLIYNVHDYEAEIDSYIYSEEYESNFGENVVPYPRSSTQSGVKNVGFNRGFALFRGDATSSNGNQAKLISDLAGNKATKIVFPASGGGTPGQNNKRYRISVTKPGSGARFRLSSVTYEVSYSNMASRIQNIQKAGGKILSITQVG
jgi:phycoerythrin-associated linker protein